MPYMMITMLIEASQGDAVAALVSEDCLAFSAVCVEKEAVEVHLVEKSRASTHGKMKGVQRTFAERPLGAAILARMHSSIDRQISRDEVREIASELGMKPASASGYLSGIKREGYIKRVGRRSDPNPRWELL